MRLVVGFLVICVVAAPLAVLAGDIKAVPSGEPPFTAIVPEPDMDKIQELDRQIEEALRAQGVPSVPPAGEPQQDNQGEQGDGQGK